MHVNSLFVCSFFNPVTLHELVSVYAFRFVIPCSPFLFSNPVLFCFLFFLSVSHLTLVLDPNINFSFVTTVLGLVSVRRVWPTVNSSVEC